MDARERNECKGTKSTGHRIVPVIHHVWGLGLAGKKESLGGGCWTENKQMHTGAGHLSEVKEKVHWE